MMFRLMETNPVLETPLVQAWQTGNETSIVSALKAVSKDAGRSDRESLSRDVFDILRATSSARVRNASALALVDLEARGLVQRIVEVLEREELAQASGTLLFALNEVEASLPIGVALDIIERGSFEARTEVMRFLAEGRLSDASEPALTAAAERLSVLAQSGEAEVAEAAEQAAECLGFDGSESRPRP